MTREFEPLPPLESVDIQYKKLVERVSYYGEQSADRTGVGTRKRFGEQIKVDLAQGFPLLTTKKVWFKGVKDELLWFISGGRNIRPLVQQNVHIWDEWPFQHYLKKQGLQETHPKYSDSWKNKKDEFIDKIVKDEEFAQEWGDLGPVYGYQWRHWNNPDGTEIDQLANAVEQIKNNPDSRRIIVTAWNPSDIDRMTVSGLPPCHMSFQFQVSGNNKLNCLMYQRSVDTFLGLPFNIASYGLLTHIVANATDKIPGELTLALGDTHIYNNHDQQVQEQLQRIPKQLPTIELTEKITDIDHINPESIVLRNYDPHPAIKAPIAV